MTGLLKLRPCSMIMRKMKVGEIVPKSYGFDSLPKGMTSHLQLVQVFINMWEGSIIFLSHSLALSYFGPDFMCERRNSFLSTVCLASVSFWMPVNFLISL